MSDLVQPDLHYILEIEPLDLGADVKAVGLDLMEVESREPAHGSDAAHIWAATLPALAANEPWVLDFFAHVDRVRDYCALHEISFEEKSPRYLRVVPNPESLAALIERFAGETFGARAGTPVSAGDESLETDLARRGVDGYHGAFGNYLYCAVCDFENGFLTLLTGKLWTSEVLRRVKPALSGLPVEVARPH
jgi:hypothetical protein